MSELALALLAAVLLVVVASESARGGRDLTNMPIASQLRLGLTCGAIGALLATLPFADVVPDRWETAAAGGAIVATAGVVLFTVLRRRRHRAGAGARGAPLDPPLIEPGAR